MKDISIQEAMDKDNLSTAVPSEKDLYKTNFIGTPPASRDDEDPLAALAAAISSQEDKQFESSKWWNHSRNGGLAESQIYQTEKKVSISKTPIAVRSLTSERKSRKHPSSCSNCGWVNAHSIVQSVVRELEQYYIPKFTELASKGDPVDKYTHLMSYKLAELLGKAHPYLMILHTHAEKCNAIPHCSWSCGEDYAKMAGVMGYLSETQMLSNASILRMQCNIKSKRDRILMQNQLLAELKNYVEQLQHDCERLKQEISGGRRRKGLQATMHCSIDDVCPHLDDVVPNPQLDSAQEKPSIILHLKRADTGLLADTDVPDDLCPSPTADGIVQSPFKTGHAKSGSIQAPPEPILTADRTRFGESRGCLRWGCLSPSGCLSALGLLLFGATFGAVVSSLAHQEIADLLVRILLKLSEPPTLKYMAYTCSN